jgi:ubiquinone/menaquinone biosynthesis C-methylase UbiE
MTQTSARLRRLNDERSVYEDPAVVASYFRKTELLKPEETILSALAPELSRARILDIGVGAGRTTATIAPLVREYVGVDFSPAMVEACRTKFAGQLRNSRFDEADARHLDAYADASFDIVLFSFNGLDSIDYPDRMRALAEVRRVLRPGGYFWFSTHNKLALRKRFSFMWPRSPRYLPGQVRRVIRMHTKNFPAFRHMRGDHCLIYDGVHDFRTWLLYIDPRRQLLDLAQLGFHDIRAFGSSDALEIPSTPEALARRRDGWIYFLCRREAD